MMIKIKRDGLTINDWNFFKKLCVYFKRIITNTGPHGKHCRCNKWGLYLGLECPNPIHKLKISLNGKFGPVLEHPERNLKIINNKVEDQKNEKRSNYI